MEAILHLLMRARSTRVLEGCAGARWHMARTFVVLVRAACLVQATCLSVSPAYSRGTPAGATIANTGQLTWIEGTSSHSVYSNSATFEVDERIDLAVVWLDAGSVPVAPGDTARVLSFRVVNAGNAPEAFRLAAAGNLAGDQWHPTVTGLALDSNGDGAYEPGVDQPYRPGMNDPELDADAGMTVFVLTDIPTGVADGSTGFASLRATAVTGSGAPGTVFAGRGEAGTDAVIGATTATAAVQGSLIASLAVPQLTKSQAILDPSGGTAAVPGAVITYTLGASYDGAVPTSDGIIEDPVPAGTTYVEGSLTLNGSALTDLADGDAGEANSTKIRVAIGGLTSAARAVVTFQVRVNN